MAEQASFSFSCKISLAKLLSRPYLPAGTSACVIMGISHIDWRH